MSISSEKLFIRRYPAYPGVMVDYANTARTTAIGIGPFGARVAKLLSTDSFCVESYEVIFDPTASCIDEGAELIATVRKSHLLFLISGFEDSYCELLFHQLAEIGKKAGVLTIGVVPEGNNWQADSPEHFAEQSKSVDTVMYISDRSLNEQQCIKTTSAEQLIDLKGELIRDVIASISHILTQAVMVTVFFDEIEAAFKSGGVARVGVGAASGAERGSRAATLAMKRLCEQKVNMESVTGAIAYLQGSSTVTLDEYEGMSRVIHEQFPEGTNVGKSILVNESMGENVTVTVVAMQNLISGRP